LPAGDEQLHEVTMLEVDEKVKECALSLADHRLLAKLAISDMIAQEAKYHQLCLVHLYNRRRSLERERYQQLSSSLPGLAHSIVFAELTAYMNDVRVFDNLVPVFKLVDLKNMYTSRLQQLNDSAVQPVNSTRLKEKLLAYFPDMQAHNDGRDVVLAFGNNIGAALTKACASDLDEDALHQQELLKSCVVKCFQGTGSLKIHLKKAARRTLCHILF
jgi:hypothetical protein